MDTHIFYTIVIFFTGIGIAVGATLMGLLWVYSSKVLDRNMISFADLADLTAVENVRLREKIIHLERALAQAKPLLKTYTEPAGEIIQSQAKVQTLKEAGKISIGEIIQD